MAIAFKESIYLGLQDFWGRKIRTIITILGIVLGTMSIMVVLSITKGINKFSMAWIMERGGLNKITIARDWQVKTTDNAKNYLTLSDIDYLRSTLKGVECYNPKSESWMVFNAGKRKADYYLVNGVLPEYLGFEEWNVSRGRFISEIDLENRSDVIVLGSTVAKDLFGSRNSIGQVINCNQKRYTVIGVMQERILNNGFEIGNRNQFEWFNRQSFMPLSTKLKKVDTFDGLYEVELKAISPDSVVSIKNQLNAILLNLNHGAKTFQVKTAMEEAEQTKKGQRMFTLVFSLISGISLLVGGIVIMNIMLSTVQERTREVGVRLAVGARRFDIFLQFLVQTVVTTVIGGIVGVILGFSILGIVKKFLGVPMESGMDMAVIGLIVSAIVGLFFGIFPAIRASNLDPVKALRHE